jgi:hypothetical protein
MAIKYTKARRHQIYPNWDFWFENMPSGTPGVSEAAAIPSLD